MNDVEKIIYTAIAGVIIWIAQKLISYLIIRSRITQSLLSEIKLNVEGIKEAYNYLKRYEDIYLIGGKKLEYVDKFIKTDNSYYRSQMNELPKYYARKTIDTISKFFYYFWELQTLIEGLMAYLNHLHECDSELSENDISRAKKKLLRIYSLADVILKKEINSLSDLMASYDGILGPDSMI
jgi:hypothetical protein